jgi:hypothetical protein
MKWVFAGSPGPSARPATLTRAGRQTLVHRPGPGHPPTPIPSCKPVDGPECGSRWIASGLPRAGPSPPWLARGPSFRTAACRLMVALTTGTAGQSRTPRPRCGHPGPWPDPALACLNAAQRVLAGRLDAPKGGQPALGRLASRGVALVRPDRQLPPFRPRDVIGAQRAARPARDHERTVSGGPVRDHERTVRGGPGTSATIVPGPGGWPTVTARTWAPGAQASPGGEHHNGCWLARPAISYPWVGRLHMAREISWRSGRNRPLDEPGIPAPSRGVPGPDDRASGLGADPA